MILIDYLKKLFRKEKSSIEPTKTTELSIIDTSDIEIDRNLTKEENESRKKLFEEIISENFSTFITYGDDIAKKTNYYMDIIRKRLNQNIDENKSLASNVSLEQAIRQKVKIIFNNAEIDSILNDLNELKRNCELRIIALEDFGNIELKKSKRKIFFMSEKTDAIKINSINNAISRLSVNIKIINMLTYSVRNEQLTYLNENYTLNTFIKDSDEKESKKIANTVLNEKFEELRSSINAIATFSNVTFPVIEGKAIDKLDINSMPLDKKVEAIVLAKKYLDLYVAQNREKLLSPGGLLERAKEYQSKLWEEIESDYLDIPLWAKKAFPDTVIKEKGRLYPRIINRFHYKYYSRLENIEKLIKVFGEEIPDDFKEKFYKTKFCFHALLCETEKFDSHKSAPIEIKSEEERKYYLKFITEIVDKMHRESNDGELIKFMDKHLSLKNPNAILEEYDKFIALLRIEEFGRDGLFTLMFYTADFKDNPNSYCCLDQINPKYALDANLQIYKYNPSTMAKDILKLWRATDNLEKRYNGFWGDYNDGWDFAEKINQGLYPRSNPCVDSYIYGSKLEYYKFLIQTIRDYNKNARENGINLGHRFYYYLRTGLRKGQFLAMYAYLMEGFSNGKFTKEEVLQYIKDKGRVTEYEIMTREILEDYLRKNLNDVDFAYFNEKFTKVPDSPTAHTKYYCSASRLGLWKRTEEDIRLFGENKSLTFDYYKFIVDTCKAFNKIGVDGWALTETCLYFEKKGAYLHKKIAKEKIKDELLKNYNISQGKYETSYDGRRVLVDEFYIECKANKAIFRLGTIYKQKFSEPRFLELFYFLKSNRKFYRNIDNDDEIEK